MAQALEHRKSSESEGFYCWCLPTVEKVQHDYDDDFTWLVIHNDPKTKGGES
jgi:hypothetical protein